jgi:hypothetical protein
MLDSYTTVMLQKWQSICRQNHPDCMQLAYRPRRLLHVGGGDVSYLRLQACSENLMPSTPEYAALSYIWGGPQQFLTLRDNVDAKMARIEIEDLPGTLRDAVLVCRAIGMQWLWVDALCIIQDDPQDKLEQLKDMGKVYQSASLTIIAATSVGSNEGFLAATFENAILPFQRFRRTTSNGREGSISLIKKLPNSPRFPIESRGWALQERLLSHRRLFFHHGRIDWVCRESHLFAGSTSSYSVNLIDEAVTRGNRYISESSLSDINSDVGLQIQRWYMLCYQLSMRKLSDPHDRFPALSGIAQEFRRNFPAIGDYVAGLWTTNLAQQLLWRISRYAEWKYRLDEFMGPSWSWVSIQSPFMLPTFVTQPANIRLEILDYEIQHPFGSDRYGRLSAGCLEVKGRLKTAQWDISSQTIESASGLLLAGNTKTVADSKEYASQGPFAGTSVHIHCLEIQDARHWVRQINTEWGPAFTGLLLLECPHAHSTYRRAGLFSLAKVDKGESSHVVFEAAVTNLAWFEDVEPQVITII